MAAGGRRQGAGRKEGSVTKKNREIAEKALKADVTPLEMILKAASVHYKARRYDDAAKMAEKAAPYVHARIQSIELTGKAGGPPIKIESLSDAQLDILIERLTRGSIGGAKG